jgi:thiol-disulfide isomerase/thioredoxin
MMGSRLVPVARSFRMIATVAVSSLALGLAGCTASKGETGVTGDTRYVADGAGVVTTYSIGHRKAAPQISGTDLDGQPLSLAQFKGKVIVLNFWASWCPPCRAEAPALQAVSSETKSMGVQFVGVDIKENGPSDAKAFVANNGIDYPSFYDQSAKIALHFRSSGVVPETPPTTLVIDRTGHIAARGLGEMRVNQLKTLVEDVAAESGGTDSAAKEPNS